MRLYQESLTWRDGIEQRWAPAEGWGDMSRILSVRRLLEGALKDGPRLFEDSGAKALRSAGYHDRPEIHLAKAQCESDFHAVKAALSHFSPFLRYDPLLAAFFSTARELGLLGGIGALTTPQAAWYWEGKPYRQAAAYDELMRRVVTKGGQAATRLALRRWNGQAEADYKSADEYVTACFKVSPQLYVLRMNLGYWGATPRGKRPLPDEDGLGRLRAAFRKLVKQLAHPKHAAIVGQMARLDYGRGKGFFYHLVVLFRGREADSAFDWYGRLTAMWEKLWPEGEGAATGCNWLYVDAPLELGPPVGLVDGRQSVGRLSLDRWVLPYVTLSSRLLRVSLKPRERIFTRGVMPGEVMGS